MARAGHLTRQVSLYAVLAAASGLVVWIATVWRIPGIWSPGGAVLQPSEYEGARWLTILLIYGPFGALLGAIVAMLEPIQDTSFSAAFRNETRWLSIGLALGFVGAVLGGLLGEAILRIVYRQQYAASHALAYTEAIDLGRLLGTTIMGIILGGCLGLIDRLRSASNARFIAGLTGGAVGGVLAALLFRFVIRDINSLTALSLMVMGACTAGAIGSITFLQTRAFLVGMKGNIYKYGPNLPPRKLTADAPNRVGSALPGRQSQSATFKVVHDLDIMPLHAEIQYSPRGRGWTLRRMSPEATELFLGERRLLSEPVPLQDGDVIMVGRTRFQFRTKL